MTIAPSRGRLDRKPDLAELRSVSRRYEVMVVATSVVAVPAALIVPYLLFDEPSMKTVLVSGLPCLAFIIYPVLFFLERTGVRESSRRAGELVDRYQARKRIAALLCAATKNHSESAVEAAREVVRALERRWPASNLLRAESGTIERVATRIRRRR